MKSGATFGMASHHYREPDPLGRVDPLVSETGASPVRIHPASFTMNRR
jgi:hypothetical protein